MERERIITAIVLDRERRAEASVMLTAFSPEDGLVFLFKRLSGKKTSLVPDLFDEIECSVSTPDADAPVKFLGQFEVLKRRAGVSASYEKLCAASEIASVAKSNGANIDEKRTLFELIARSLDAIEAHDNHATVKIKFLYLLARNQGYAIKEDFFRSLADADKSDFSEILALSTADQAAEKPRSERLYEMLKRWILSETDIVF